MSQASFNETFELREYAAVLRTRKWTILLITTLVVGLALLLSVRQEPLYRGTARLLVKSLPEDASGTIQEPNLDTEAQIIISEPVAERVKDELGLQNSPQELIDTLQVAAVTDVAEVLELSYSSPDPELAGEIPNAFALEYIEYKEDQTRQALESGERAIQAQIDAVEQRLAEVTQAIEEAGPQEDSDTLETERSSLLARLGVLQQKADDFQARRPINLSGGQLIETAKQPGSPYSPNHIANGLRAMVIGLALGIGMAFLRERLDDRLRGRHDLEAAIGFPVLATVPRFPTANKKAQEIVVISQPRGLASEAYRSLRTGLQFLSGQKHIKSLLLTSPSEGEGKTVTTVNLAVAFAQSGRRVILVSADLRRPSLETYFDFGNEKGVTSWLSAEHQDPWGLARESGIANLLIVPTGPVPPNPAELLASPRLTQLIDVLEMNSDLVIVDSPPVLAVADAAILATHVDATVLVVDSQSTHRSAAVLAAEELQRIGAGLIGAVLNMFDPVGTPYHQYEYLSHYDEAAKRDGAKRDRGKKSKSRLSLRR